LASQGEVSVASPLEPQGSRGSARWRGVEDNARGSGVDVAGVRTNSGNGQTHDLVAKAEVYQKDDARGFSGRSGDFAFDNADARKVPEELWLRDRPGLVYP
jgi:hypothetical protein